MVWPAEFKPLSAMSAFGKPWNRLSGVRFSWKITTTCLNLCEYVGGGLEPPPPPPPHAKRPVIRAAKPAIKGAVNVPRRRRGIRQSPSGSLGWVCPGYNTATPGKLRLLLSCHICELCSGRLPSGHVALKISNVHLCFSNHAHSHKFDRG